jgi:predicted small secreted protein
MIVVLALAPAGCNTLHGMGEDIEAGGQAMQKLVEGD